MNYSTRKVRVEFENDLDGLINWCKDKGGWVADDGHNREWFSLAWNPSEIMLAKPGSYELASWAAYVKI